MRYKYLLFFMLWGAFAMAQPVVNLGNDTTICSGSLTLNAGNAGASFIWNTGETTQTIIVNTSGTYWVDVTNVGGTTRDSITLTIVPAVSFSRPDTVLCSGAQSLGIQGNSSYFYTWFDAATGGNALFQGQTWASVFTNSATYYIEGRNILGSVFEGFTSTTAIGANSGYYPVGVSRGLLFDVLQTAYLMSVQLPMTTGNLTGRIEIYNASNALIYSKNVALQANSSNTINLGVTIPAGTGYRIMFVPVSGTGNLHVSAGSAALPYPYTYSFLRVNNGTPNTGQYNYFYNFRIATMACASARQPFVLTVNPSPIVNLPTDSISCAGSVTLDATFPNAAYLWSNGATTATSAFTQSQRATVQILAMGCVGFDTTNLVIGNTPMFSRPDTVTCSGSQTIAIAGNASNLYTWYDAATNGNAVYQGQAWTNNFTASASYYIEGLNILTTATEGFTSTTAIGGNSGYYAVGVSRGLLFDVLRTVYLTSVQLPMTTGNLAGRIEIYNSANAVVYSKNVALQANSSNTIQLGVSLAAGTGYRIIFVPVSGTGNLHVSALSGALPFPYTYNYLRITNGTPNTGQYNYFYNLQLATNVCQSARQPFNLTVNPSPIVSLPTDTLSCTGSIALDATYPNSSYLWSNGATTATSAFTQSQRASVRVTALGCTATDTSNVIIGTIPTFVRPDTVTCSGNQTIGIAGDASYFYTWFDAASGANFSYEGQAWANNFTVSDTYYIQSTNVLSNIVEGFTSTTAIGGNSGYYPTSTSTPRGLLFDVLRTTFLVSVQLPMTTGSVSGNVEIYNSSNTLLYRKSITLQPNSSNTIPLGVSLAVGTGYRMMFVPVSGVGNLHVSALSSALPFPYTYNYLRINNGTPNAGQYNYFYNLQLATNVCQSARQPFNLTVNPTPIVNLPIDTLSCNNGITLDVTNVGATYLWGDGVTTATHAFAQSEYIDVQVARGQCIAYDTIQIYVRDTAQLTAHDTTLCGGANTLLLNANSGYSYFWWTQPSSGTLINLGQTYSPTLYDTAVYYIEGRTTLRSYYEGVMDTSVIRSFGSGYYAVGDMRGTQFDALSNIILGSVVVYVDGLLTGNVILRNSSGVVLGTRAVTLGTGTNTIPLNFNIPQGTGYQLLFTNSSGGGKWHASFDTASTPTYPRLYAHLRQTGQVLNGIAYTSGNNSKIYAPFYKWEIVETACPTARYPFTANVLPTPILQLPTDTVICNTSLTLNAASANNAGAAYQWSTGQTTAQIVVNQSSVVAVRATIGVCEDSASVNVLLSNPPTFLDAPNDTVVCGGGLTLYSITNGYTSAWYTTPTGSNPIAIADSIVYNASQTDTLWVEGVGFLPKLNLYGATSQGQVTSSFYVSPVSVYSTRGLEFDVLNTIKLDQVSVFIDSAAVHAKIILQNQYGLELQAQWVSLPSLGENVLPVNWIIPSGAGYKLILDSISGGRVYAMPYNFPLVAPEIVLQRGYPANVLGLYNYFYKWRISTPSCPTSRVPVRIDVPPYPIFTMPSDTAVCDASNNLQLAATLSNANYAYQWNTGATSNAITPIQTGYYHVTVTNNGLCASVMSCFVQYLLTPQAAQQQDTTICASGNVSFFQNSPTLLYNWYRINGAQTYVGAPYSPYVADTSSFVVETAARVTTRVGTQGSSTPYDANQYKRFIIPNTFNVTDWAILDSVAVYVENAPATFNIVLSDTLGRPLATRTVTVTQPYTKTFLPLDFVLRPANGYQLKFDNISTNFLVNPQATYPATTSAGVATLTGTTLPQTNYACFMDWHFSYASSACVAPTADTFIAAVQIPLMLPSMPVFACYSYMADATAGGSATYLWSTGDTTPTTMLTDEGLYTVTITDGACAVVDSLVLDKPEPVALPSGVNCGNTLVNSYTTEPNTLFRWNTGATTASIYMLGASDYSVTVTTSTGCVLVDSTTITHIDEVPAFDLGAAQTLCEGDTITTGLGIYPNLSFRWQNGDSTYFTAVHQTQSYIVTVTTANQCSATDYVAITVRREPVAAFGISYVSGKTVGLSNLSQGLGIYSINYGDNNNYTSSLFHTYADEGCYTITMLVENNCGEDSMTTQYATPDTSCVVGVEFVENAANGFEIVPNPNNGEFALQPKATLYDDSDIFIYNMQGVCVWQRLGEFSSMPTIDATKLPAGAYIVQWRNQQFVQSKRFILLK